MLCKVFHVFCDGVAARRRKDAQFDEVRVGEWLEGLVWTVGQSGRRRRRVAGPGRKDLKDFADGDFHPALSIDEPFGGKLKLQPEPKLAEKLDSVFAAGDIVT